MFPMRWQHLQQLLRGKAQRPACKHSEHSELKICQSWQQFFFFFFFPGPGDNIHSIFVSYGSRHAPIPCLFWCPDIKQKRQRIVSCKGAVSISKAKKNATWTQATIWLSGSLTTSVVSGYPGDTLPPVCLEYEWGDHFLHIDPLRGKTDNICCLKSCE